MKGRVEGQKEGLQLVRRRGTAVGVRKANIVVKGMNESGKQGRMERENEAAKEVRVWGRMIEEPRRD